MARPGVSQNEVRGARQEREQPEFGKTTSQNEKTALLATERFVRGWQNKNNFGKGTGAGALTKSKYRADRGKTKK